MLCLLIAVGLFASVVSFGPPPPERRAELAGIFATPTSSASSASVDAEELSARTARLFERGEVGEAIEIARRAAAAAPEQPGAWAVLDRLHAVAGHEAQARASFVACAAHPRAREVEACSAFRQDFPAR